MRVTRIDAYALRAPLPTVIRDARSEIRERGAVLVRVEVDHGRLAGWGEAACFGGVGSLVVATVRHLAGPLVGGLVEPRRITRDLRRTTAHFGQRGLVVSAISGIEIALWDVLGKAAGVPVSALFGVLPRPIPVYTTTGFYRSDDRAQAMRDLQADVAACDLSRFCGAKIKVGRFGVADDVERAQHARRILGPEGVLVLDANNAYSPIEAARLAAAVEALDVLFLEEPIAFGLPEESTLLRYQGRVAVGGYELEPTFDACERYVRLGAVDYIQPDATWSGGIGECVSIADMADRHGVRMVPHNFSTQVGTAANYHAACVGASPPDGVGRQRQPAVRRDAARPRVAPRPRPTDDGRRRRARRGRIRGMDRPLCRNLTAASASAWCSAPQRASVRP